MICEGRYASEDFHHKLQICTEGRRRVFRTSGTAPTDRQNFARDLPPRLPPSHGLSQLLDRCVVSQVLPAQYRCTGRRQLSNSAREMRGCGLKMSAGFTPSLCGLSLSQGRPWVSSMHEPMGNLEDCR